MRDRIKEGLRKWQPGIHLVIAWFSVLGDWPNCPWSLGVVSINFRNLLTHNQSDMWISTIPHVPLHLEKISAERESRFDEGLKLRLVQHGALSSDRREKN